MVLFCSVKIFSGSQISVASPLGNLKEYVLNGRCEETFIVTFLSQVTSALFSTFTKTTLYIQHFEPRM